MMKFLKRASSVALALLMVFSLGATVFAADSTITFKGNDAGFEFRPGSTYTDTDLFDSFKGVLPGDVLTEEITFTNDATDSDYIKLYMRAVAHDEKENPLSENVAKEVTLGDMNAFLSKLSMKVWNGTELIYEASPDQTGGLTDNVFLGEFRTGDKATLKVELIVPETLGNDDMAIGEVDWEFTAESFNTSQLTVRKVWSDGASKHRDDIVEVNLLKNGEVEETVELMTNNGWAYTFNNLDEGYTWTVEEAEVPAGYKVSYDTDGNTVTITNTKKGENTPPPPSEDEETVDIIVKKVWSNDASFSRPSSVTVTLYNGKTAYKKVKLSEENNWTYHWKNLSESGDWQVLETSIPKGYTPSYKVSGNKTVITNTHKLIQTGQLNWPIAVLGGAGIALVALGGVIMLKKKKQNNA